MKRWLVERSHHNFEDVGYEYMRLDPSGALVFSKGVWAPPEYVVAAGQWLTVVEGDV